MALKTDNLPSARLKMRRYIDETLFHDVEMLFVRIFYILGVSKFDLDEVAKMMF
jgi:hypothetical protein